VIEVLRLHTAHVTAETMERRKHKVEDVAKRAAYRKAHGLDQIKDSVDGLPRLTMKFWAQQSNWETARLQARLWERLQRFQLKWMVRKRRRLCLKRSSRGRSGWEFGEKTVNTWTAMI